jgi:hypothetical protein
VGRQDLQATREEAMLLDWFRRKLPHVTGFYWKRSWTGAVRLFRSSDERKVGSVLPNGTTWYAFCGVVQEEFGTQDAAIKFVIESLRERGQL